MRLKIINAVGILCSDPFLPGRMYLSKAGGLTKHISKAKLVKPEVVEEALREVKEYSHNTFIKDLVDTK